MRLISFRSLASIAMTGALLSTGACSMSDLVDVQKPSSILDPSAVETYDGAIAIYNSAMTKFATSFGGRDGAISGPYIVASGLMSDEFNNYQNDAIVSRNDVEGGVGPVTSSTSGTIYSYLQTSRVRAGEGLDYLRAYAPTAPQSYLADMYMIRGYVEDFMAEAFCSGVPLSELIFHGDLQLGTQLTTEELLQHALTQFDSAATLAGDSTYLRNAATMGRARVLLNLKRYDEAMTAVASIPTNYSFAIRYATTATQGYPYWATGAPYNSVANAKGTNGLDYLTSNDPRVPVVNGGSYNSIISWQPVNLRSSPVNIPVANGIEARLIEAEVLLSQGKIPEWLTTLNTLRTNGTYTVDGTDTTWNAGTGGVAGLRPLDDPGTATNARLLLTFREKAFWLFGTGHRQGDLRRLVRQYGVPSNDIYPTGVYQAATNQQVGIMFGSQVTLVPSTEGPNPNYHGCIDREA